MVLFLVGGIPTPLKNMKFSWDDDSQYMEITNDPNHQPDFLISNSSLQQENMLV
jgi:hypothetical protein